DGSQQYVLYSLQPLPMGFDAEERNAVTTFHGFRILGQTPIRDAKVKSRLLAAFYDGIGSSDGMVAGCFNPRHGIRAGQSPKSLDIVVCFQCEQIEIHDEHGKRTVPITRSPQPVLDRILSEAGVVLASPP